MFHIEDISDGIFDQPTLIKVTSVDPIKINDISFEPRSCILTKCMERYLGRIRNFTIREDDVWIVTFPKSGTTWLQEMCWLILNNYNFEEAKTVDIGVRCQLLELSCIFDYAADSIEYAEKLESPRFLHSHLPLPFLPKEFWTQNPKILYVSRDPRDVVVSFYEYAKSLRNLTLSKDETFKAFISDKLIFTPYFDHVLEFWKIRNNPNILFLSYEEMRGNLESVILRTCKFLNKNITSEQLVKLLDHLSFNSMKKNKACQREYQRAIVGNVEPNNNYCLVRRGIVGSYKDELPKELHHSFNEWMRRNLKSTDCDLFRI